MHHIDPDSWAPFEEMLKVLPGGINAVTPLEARRKVLNDMFTQLANAMHNDNVEQDERIVPGPEGDPMVKVRVYRPVKAEGALPGLLYIHGGGMVLGNLEAGHADCLTFCEALDAVIVNVEYRLAPENPHPAPSEDCYAALVWMAENAAELGIDAENIAIYGPSAGGGLAVATALLARDRGGPSLVFMMPIYPMLDDRNDTPSSHEVTPVGVWDRSANIEAWGWYLGDREPDYYAAPARCEDVSGLPPTFIDVGTLDLFRDEDIAFASRLLAAGVPTELHVYPGAYHGSDTLAPMAPLSQRIIERRLSALRRALHPGSN